jgi:hypothetical protein
MALVPLKTSTSNGYCDCICGCYNLAAVREDDTGKSYCPSCAKDHLDLNRGIGLPQAPPSKMPEGHVPGEIPQIPETADPPGRLR